MLNNLFNRVSGSVFFNHVTIKYWHDKINDFIFNFRVYWTLWELLRTEKATESLRPTLFHQILTMICSRFVWMKQPSINRRVCSILRPGHGSSERSLGFPPIQERAAPPGLSYLTTGPPPSACWSPICSVSAQTSWTWAHTGIRRMQSSGASEWRN